MVWKLNNIILLLLCYIIVEYFSYVYDKNMKP